MGRPKTRPKFWILHFEERDRAPNQVRKEWVPPFAIQLMSPHGGPSDEIVHFDKDAEALEIGGISVPSKAIEVAQSIPPGQGRYLDENGEIVDLF